MAGGGGSGTRGNWHGDGGGSGGEFGEGNGGGWMGLGGGRGWQGMGQFGGGNFEQMPQFMEQLGGFNDFGGQQPQQQQFQQFQGMPPPARIQQQQYAGQQFQFGGGQQQQRPPRLVQQQRPPGWMQQQHPFGPGMSAGGGGKFDKGQVVKEHGKKEFMVKFLSAHRLVEMSNYPYFGLKGSKNVINISKWSPAVDAFLKLTTVWVRASRVPQPFLHRDGFAEVGSLIGAFKDADMQGFRDTCVIRIKVGVRDPEKIPEMGELTDVPFVYHIHFELEQFFEEGGYLKNGVVIKNDEVDGSETNPSQERFTKRTRNGSDDRQGGRSLGNGGVDSLMTDVVPSSQAETDKQMEEVLRKKMLLRQTEEAKISIGVDEEEEELVDYNSSGKGEDWTGNDEEDSDEFARKVGN
ncbi:hypothetical protein ACQ4PT_020537 [Festuca glaucescens]